MLESVLLPAPFSPSRACTSPAWISRSTPAFAMTPGNRFVTPRSVTAATGAVTLRQSLTRGRSALGGADDALHEPVHAQDVVQAELLALGDAKLACLVVDRALELVEGAVLDRSHLGRDRRLRLRRNARAERREPDELVVEAAPVGVALPRAGHRGLGLLEVVGTPVVDRGGEPGLGRERLGVGVVPDPRDPRGLRVLTGRGRVHVLPHDIGAA